MTTNSPSFRSPLLASLRPRGGDDAVPRSPASSDDDVLMRRRTPGGAERPAPSPGLFPASSASTAPHRPSPLGLPPRTTATTTTFGSSATPRSGTGTNFKARLQAMQASGGSASAAATPPPGDLMRPGSLGWGGGVPAYRPLQRPVPTTAAAAAAAALSPLPSAATAGPAPPGASLADELHQLRLEVDNISLAGTPTKTGPVGGLSSAPATPASVAAASPSLKGLSVHPGARIPTPGGVGVPQWSPMVASGAGRSRGRKAMGAGALSVSRSSTAAPVAAAGTPSGGLGVAPPPETMAEALRSRSQSPTKAPRGGGAEAAAADVVGPDTSSAVEGLRRRLRAEMPEFGVGDWEPPAAPPPHQPQGLPKSERGAGGSGDTLAALAALRREADVQLQGGEGSAAAAGSAATDSVRDEDVVCKGVRAAFREALGTPSKAAAAAAGERGVEGSSRAARKTPPPPKEVEQRLERLRLLREQAVKVAAMPSPSSSKGGLY